MNGPSSRTPPLRGLVLAGGRSTRMGRDKAGILVEGDTLLDRTVSLLGSLVADVHVGVQADQATDDLRRQHQLLFDVSSELGPAGGLLAAHALDVAAAWLVLACDMPGLERPMLSALISARDPARGATAWRSPADGQPEPLCAIWEPATLARLAVAAGQGNRSPVSPRAVLATADTLLLTPSQPAALLSVNTPADLHRYREQAHGHQP